MLEEEKDFLSEFLDWNHKAEGIVKLPQPLQNIKQKNKKHNHTIKQHPKTETTEINSKEEAAGGNLSAAVQLKEMEPPLGSQPAVAGWK